MDMRVSVPDAARDAAPDALTIEELTVAYNGKPVLVSLDWRVPAGAMAAIVGPNGAGKSTLLKAALGIVPRISGTVSVFGTPIGKAMDRIAYMPQRASVDWEFPATAIDVVMMGLFRQIGWFGLARRRHRETALACLDRVGLADFAGRQIGQLSGGQQQRVFLARALAQDADLNVMDEPFAGVDAATEQAILAVLKELNARGRTVICVHHDLETVQANFTDVLLVAGKRIAAGPVATTFTKANLALAYGGRLAEARPELAAIDAA